MRWFLWGVAPHPTRELRPLDPLIGGTNGRFSNQRRLRLKFREHGGFHKRCIARSNAPFGRLSGAAFFCELVCAALRKCLYTSENTNPKRQTGCTKSRSPMPVGEKTYAAIPKAKKSLSSADGRPAKQTNEEAVMADMACFSRRMGWIRRMHQHQSDQKRALTGVFIGETASCG